jgi:hypothetical protein
MQAVIRSRIVSTFIVVTLMTWFLCLSAGSGGVMSRASIPGEKNAEDIRAYSGLGSWVDLYNKRPWRQPEQVVAEMASRGVQTIYLETSSYRFRKAIVHRDAVGTYIDLAHEYGMSVVAWYVPSFKPVERDYRRAMAAIGFVSPSGQTFDSFALDIEVTVVGDVQERNARTRRLSRAIRSATGDDYPLAAIVPDPVGSLYWTDFPYRSLGRIYDSFLPMSYFTFRVDGARAVRRYIRANVRAVRERTGIPDAPVHPIGGIADVAPLREVNAYVEAIFDEGGLGGSLYDFPLMRPRQWESLEVLRSTRIEPTEEPEPPLFRHLHVV